MANKGFGDFVQSKMASKYSTLSTMVSDIGATPTLVRMNKSFSPSANITIPNNIFFEWDGTSVIAPSSGTVVTLGSLPKDANRQIFTGLGQVRPAKGAVSDGILAAILWVGDGSASPVTVTEAMWTGMRYGLYNNQGCDLVFPIGEYNYTYEPILQVGRIRGAGQSPNVQGTILRQQTDGAACLRLLPGSRNVFIEDMVLDPSGLSTGGGVLAQGDGSTDYNIQSVNFHNTTIYGGAYGFKVNDTYAGQGYWQVNGVKTTRSCLFIGQTVACIDVNAVNTSLELNGALHPGAGAWEVIASGVGRLYVNNEGGGALVSPTCEGFTFTSSDVTAGSDKITKASHGLSTNDPVYLSNSGGALPAGLSAATKYFVSVSGNDIKFHNTSSDSNAVTNAIDITGGGTGTHTLHSTRPTAAGLATQPAGGIKLVGPWNEGIVFGPMRRSEGIRWDLWIDPSVAADYMGPIDWYGTGQGQVYLGGPGGQMNLYGGWMVSESIHDSINSNWRVCNFGTRIYTYGVGGDYNNYGGYEVPEPRLDNFIGTSYMQVDTLQGATIIGANANDTTIFGWRVFNRDTNIKLQSLVNRLSSGVKAGWYKFTNSMFGVNNAQAGFDFEGGLGYAGRLLNDRDPDAADTGTSGHAAFDLSLNHCFTLTPNSDRALDFSNGPSGHSMLIEINVLTSGTTSYNLTAGTNAVMQAGAFATGTTSGAHHVLLFWWNGTYAIEVGRPSPSSLLGTVAADILELHGAGNAIKFFDRAANSGSVIAYSPTVGVWALFHGSGDVMKVDQSSTAGHTRLFLYDVDNGQLERVTVGAADSGGSGYKVLRIPN